MEPEVISSNIKTIFINFEIFFKYFKNFKSTSIFLTGSSIIAAILPLYFLINSSKPFLSLYLKGIEVLLKSLGTPEDLVPVKVDHLSFAFGNIC